jgi:gluconate kinase
MTTCTPIIVIFGKPGAGKSTLADAAIARAKAAGIDRTLALDLDVCVPHWMRDNFKNGIYPSLQQRKEFALSACDYVDSKLDNSGSASAASTAAIISFSFVNTDLRDVFRERFPHARWALMDVTDEVAKGRIDAREGHFYKGAPPGDDSSDVEQNFVQGEAGCAADSSSNDNNQDEADVNDNSEWNFAPVSFSHTRLDGNEDVEVNAAKVLSILHSIL